MKLEQCFKVSGCLLLCGIIHKSALQGKLLYYSTFLYSAVMKDVIRMARGLEFHAMERKLSPSLHKDLLHG